MVDQMEPIHCVSNNLHQTARAVSRIYGEAMRPSGIKRSQFAILSSLHKLGSITLSELADMLYMERTTLTRNLKPLQKQGLITITRSARDARAREICLTREGKEKYQLARKLWRKAQRQILTAFGEEKWQQLEETLKTLRQLTS